MCGQLSRPRRVYRPAPLGAHHMPLDDTRETIGAGFVSPRIASPDLAQLAVIALDRERAGLRVGKKAVQPQLGLVAPSGIRLRLVQRQAGLGSGGQRPGHGVRVALGLRRSEHRLRQGSCVDPVSMREALLGLQKSQGDDVDAVIKAPRRTVLLQ